MFGSLDCSSVPQCWTRNSLKLGLAVCASRPLLTLYPDRVLQYQGALQCNTVSLRGKSIM